MSNLTCPRCGQETLNPKLVHNALSRKDNQTYICSPCGQAEAIEEWHNFLKEEEAKKNQ